MKGFINAIQAFYPRKKQHHFLITSHGQTASMWLAAILNRIPEIFCSHGYTYPAKGAYLAELSSDDWAHRQASFQRFETLPLKKYFAELKSATKKPIVGNVLAFYLGRLFARMNQKKKRNFTIVNMVRHPVTRLTSTIKTWSSDDGDFMPPFVELDFATRCDHLKNFLSKSHQVDFSINKNKVFLVALLAMEDIANDVMLAKRNNIQNVKYEDITTNQEALKQLVCSITLNKVILSKKMLDEIFSSNKINAHNKTGIVDARLQYQSWEPWQQDAFAYTLKQHDLLNVYQDLNYDFTFV